MTTFAPKTYQQQVLDSVEAYFKACHELPSPSLARFCPSGVMELTATPDLERTPSNVLHSVSAAELKAEEMIKLPVVLETEPNWQQCLADAISRRDTLHKLADEERRSGGAYLPCRNRCATK